MCIRGEKGGTAAVDELLVFLAAINGDAVWVINLFCALNEAKTA